MNLSYLKTVRALKERNLKQSPMKTKEFTSSTIKKIDYNEETKVLTVTFMTNRKYEYYGVPAEVWELTASAESIGKFVGSNIKGIYEYRAIE